ncbi:GTP-binding protein, partial [Bacillus cereus group sp. Bce039]
MLLNNKCGGVMRIVTPIPVHVVTGFLGSGKSTLIHELLKLKPAGE